MGSYHQDDIIYIYNIYLLYIQGSYPKNRKHRDLLQYLATWHSNVSLHIVHICNWLTGWWFETFFIFPYIWECHHPKWRTNFFHRGRYTTNQIYVMYSNIFHGDIQWFGFAMMICWIFSSCHGSNMVQWTFRFLDCMLMVWQTHASVKTLALPLFLHRFGSWSYLSQHLDQRNNHTRWCPIVS